MKVGRPFAVTAAFVLTFGSMIMIVPPVESEAYSQITYEDFYDGWDPDRWNVTDHNTDSGYDYWGWTTHRKLLGNGSMWCAQIGVSSVDDDANSDNHFYDQDMQAVLQTTLPSMSGYESVTLEFYYWAETGTTALSDYLEVRAWNGWFWQHLWKQPEVDTGGTWDLVMLDIPLNSIWLSFSFVSDDSVGAGPYEGVYVDGISIYGWDETPPTSSMTDLEEYYASETIYITYTAVDRGGSGVDHVELYYRKHGSGNYEMYTTPDNAAGTWTEGVIPFNCSLADGCGGYDFYTLAEDFTANRETPTVIPQTSAMFDIIAPSTEAFVVGGSLPEGWINDSASMELDSSDDLSGVAVTMYRIDSGAWEEYDGDIEISGEGEHTIAFYSEDNAGNKEGAKSIEFAIDTISPNATLSLSQGITVIASPTATFSWESEDDLSGVDYCLFKVDDRAFEFLSDSEGTVEVVRLDDGGHTAALRAYDHAGNYIETTFAFEVDLDETEAETETESVLLEWTVAIAVLVVAMIAVLLLMRSYRKGAP